MNWINWAWIGGGLLGSLIVGLIIGRIVAGIKYPNPDKPHIFTPKQSVIILVGVVVAVALIVFALSLIHISCCNRSAKQSAINSWQAIRKSVFS